MNTVYETHKGEKKENTKIIRWMEQQEGKKLRC